MAPIRLVRAAITTAAVIESNAFSYSRYRGKRPRGLARVPSASASLIGGDLLVS